MIGLDSNKNDRWVDVAARGEKGESLCFLLLYVNKQCVAI